MHQQDDSASRQRSVCSGLPVPEPIFSLRDVGMVLLVISSLLLPHAALALTDDADKPIHITGRSAEMDRTAQTLVYHGNVRIDQGTLRVVADTMVVEYEKEQVVRIIATGAPARYQQQLEATRVRSTPTLRKSFITPRRKRSTCWVRQAPSTRQRTQGRCHPL